jgi:hypothetical protein
MTEAQEKEEKRKQKIEQWTQTLYPNLNARDKSNVVEYAALVVSGGYFENNPVAFLADLRQQLAEADLSYEGRIPEGPALGVLSACVAAGALQA